MSVVHFPTSITSTMRRGDALLEVTTRCGKKLKVGQPKGKSLLDVGLSGWHSEMTCPACKNPSNKGEEHG
jgi:hypothetical protein